MVPTFCINLKWFASGEFKLLSGNQMWDAQTDVGKA